MPEEGIGRAREVRAGEIPALFAVDDQLVPGDAAGPWLVRVGDEPRCAVGRPCGGDRHAVRPVVGGVAADRGQFARAALARLFQPTAPLPPTLTPLLTPTSPP